MKENRFLKHWLCCAVTCLCSAVLVVASGCAQPDSSGPSPTAMDTETGQAKPETDKDPADAESSIRRELGYRGAAVQEEQGQEGQTQPPNQQGSKEKTTESAAEESAEPQTKFAEPEAAEEETQRAEEPESSESAGDQKQSTERKTAEEPRPAAAFRGQVERQGDVERRQDQQQAWLGVILQKQEEGQGVLIDRIYPSGPAARAGLYSGDVVLQIEGERVSSPDRAAEMLSQFGPGEQVEMTVLRGDEEITLQATLGASDDFLLERQRRSREQDGDEQSRRAFYPHNAMMLEQHRRFAEQHQRIEELLYELKDEVRQLREQIGGQTAAKFEPSEGAIRDESRESPEESPETP